LLDARRAALMGTGGRRGWIQCQPPNATRRRSGKGKRETGLTGGGKCVPYVLRPEADAVDFFGIFADQFPSRQPKVLTMCLVTASLARPFESLKRVRAVGLTPPKS
jgi:hypothetical protein